MYIAIDFDGTCVDHRFPHVGPACPGAIETLKDLVKIKHKLILFTMRSEKYLKAAVAWFELNGIELYGIQTNPTQAEWTSSNKCYAHLYIDDAAFGAPMIKPEGFERECIDWAAVRDHFDLEPLQ